MKTSVIGRLKRTLCAALVLGMLLGLSPAYVRAAGGTVLYHRANPEVAILNAYNGSDASFYSKKLKGNTSGNESDRAAYWQYNAVTLFKLDNGTGASAQYSTRATNDTTWAFNFASGSVLKQLIQPVKNLEVNASATFYNRTHTHSNFQLSSFRNWETTITSYESMGIGIAGSYGTSIAGSMDRSRQYPRIGDLGGTGGGYRTLNYYENKNYCSLHFYPSVHRWTDFEQRECTCGKTWAENVLVTFRDTRAPQLVDVQYKIDNGSYASFNKGASLGLGRTLSIKLCFDEPIRFADDSAAGKGDLYLDLQADGETGGKYRARLTELNGNDLIFQYKLEEELDVEIAAIGMGGLFASDATLNLVQVTGGTSFRITDRSGEGFDKSRCYITDLAGNPLRNETVSEPKLKLDSGAPEAARVEFRLSTNNADVKQALGKDQWDVGSEQYKKDYTDASDTHLGVGDSFYLIVHMNERLKGVERQSSGSLTWENAVFTTSLLDADNKPVTVNSWYFYPYNESQTEATQFITHSVTIQPGYHLAEGYEQIEVIKMAFADGNGITLGDITDLAGNKLDKSNVKIRDSANNNPPFLDAAAPTVTVDGGYAAEGTGFRYGVELGDTGSGYAGISGSFILNHNGDGKAYPYEWAVTADPATTADTKWTVGTTGAAQEFIQTQKVYFHIRPVSGETYVDFSGCTITVKARDYAGNESNALIPPEGSTENRIVWYIDNLAPTAAAGSVDTKLKADGSGDGTITVEVRLTDGRGISQWWYAWTDSADTEPTAWQDGALEPATTADGATVSAAGDVSAKELFSKYLWVRAADNIAGDTKNVSAPICLGKFSYDLRDAEYKLGYTNSITTRPSIKVSELGADDCVLIMVPANNSPDTNLYAVQVYQNKTLTFNHDSNIFDAGGWYYYTVTKDETGIYTLTEDENETGKAFMDQFKNTSGYCDFSGELNVRILAGKYAEVVKTESGALSALGSEQYHFAEDNFTLRVAGFTNDLFGRISLSCSDNFGFVSYLDHWKTSENYTQRTTLAGMRFTVSIESDNRGWNYENVDWQNSYILLNSTDGKEYRVPVGPFQPEDPKAPSGRVTQTVTVPEGDYASGVYTARFQLAVKAGKNPGFAWIPSAGNPDTDANIVVDTREANSDFRLSSVLYVPQANSNRNAYGILDNYGENGELECVPDGSGIIYLPISKESSYIAWGAGEYYLTVTSPDEDPLETHTGYSQGYSVYTGRYAVQLWNTAEAHKNNKVELTTYYETQCDQTRATTRVSNGIENYGVGFTFDTGTESSTKLYLTPGEVNTIAVQKIYENGRKSEIRYYQIMPVEEIIEGSVSLDKADQQLVFTPLDIQNAIGATVYAWAWKNGQDAAGGEGKRIDMTAQADGTWRCALLPDGASYEVITVSAHGSICDAGSASQRTPWFNDAPNASDGGAENLVFQDHGNGTYTLTFRIRDDYGTMTDGLDFEVGFNEDYSADKLSFTYDGTDVYWTTNDGSPTGIYSVTAVKNVYLTGTAFTSRDYLDVTVEGVFANVTGTMDVTVTATDAFGNAGSVSTSQPVRYVAPAVTDHAINTLTFNQPVRPVESWAWHEKDGDGFRTEWTGAFPIPGNGTWSIQYKDAFGQTHGAEVTTTDFTIGVTDYSIDLGFSTTDITSEAVTLTTNAANGTILVYEVDGTWHTTMPPFDGSPNVGTQKRQTRISKNMETQVELKDADGGNVLRLRVYIDNIVTGAPAAELRYYVEQLGQEFTAEELADYVGSGLTVTGNVRAWYTTERRVTPTGDSGSEFVFTPANQRTAHTFTYTDDLGNPGSAEARLPADLTLKSYVEPPEDKKAPDVSVDVYVRRGGVYSRAESFQPGDDAAARLAALSYVQGYSLTVNASDESGFDIAVTGAELTGNVVTIDGPGEVTIRVTDRSRNKNEAVMTFVVQDLFDTTAPTGTVAASADSLYTKTLTLEAVDTDNHGNVISGGASGSVMLDAPTGAQQAGVNRFTYQVLENGTVRFLFRDIAGNTGKAEYSVTGIDTDPPQLTVRWSPSLRVTDVETGKYTYMEEYPTDQAVNTNITAHIDSDKAMYDLSVKVAGADIALLDKGKATADNPYVLRDPQTGLTIAVISAAPERVTVTYEQGYGELAFTASAANRKASTADLASTHGLIDKDKPVIDEQQHKLTRGSFTVPYAVWVWLTPNETVTSPNYGGWTSYELADGTVERLPDEYADSYPLRITFTENGSYKVRFADKAGNVTIHTVTVTDIDNTAPELTLGTPVISGKTAAVQVTVSEPCTVTWGENGSLRFDAAGSNTITITENGTFAVTATDAAGNKSFKMVTVGSIDDIAPIISFTSGTIYVRAGIKENELKAELNKGFTAQDNSGAAPTVGIDIAAVKLDTAGQYTVIYTATDAAGNVTTATRIVRVIGADTACVSIDGKLVMPESTAVLRLNPPDHTLTLENSTEPFSIKARAGILSAGQMKYLSGSSLSFDANGNFSVATPGYYTLLVTTQSRQTIRILLYVER